MLLCTGRILYLPSIKPKSPRTTSDNVTKEKFASLSANLKAEAHVVDSSIGAEHQHIDALEESIDKRIKAIEGALGNGRRSLADLELAMEELEKRMDDRVRLQNKNMTSVSKDGKENKGSRFEVEVMKQELSQREALRLARLRFQAGVATQREVVDNQRDLTRAQLRYVTAIADYNISLAELRRRTGLDQVASCSAIDLPAEKSQFSAPEEVQIKPTPNIPACQASLLGS